MFSNQNPASPQLVGAGVSALSGTIGSYFMLQNAKTNLAILSENLKNKLEMLTLQNKAKLSELTKNGNKFMGTEYMTLVKNGWGGNEAQIKGTSELIKLDLQNTADYYKAQMQQELNNTTAQTQQIKQQGINTMIGAAVSAVGVTAYGINDGAFSGLGGGDELTGSLGMDTSFGDIGSGLNDGLPPAIDPNNVLGDGVYQGSQMINNVNSTSALNQSATGSMAGANNYMNIGGNASHNGSLQFDKFKF